MANLHGPSPQISGYGLVVLGDDSGLTPWRRISFSAWRFRLDCCPMASRFTPSAHVGQIELVSTSRIPHSMHIFGFSAIHVSFPSLRKVVPGQRCGVKAARFGLDRPGGLVYNNAPGKRHGDGVTRRRGEANCFQRLSPYTSVSASSRLCPLPEGEAVGGK